MLRAGHTHFGLAADPGLVVRPFPGVSPWRLGFFIKLSQTAGFPLTNSDWFAGGWTCLDW